LDPLQGCRLIGACRVLHGIKDSTIILHSRAGCYCGILLLNALHDQSDVRIVCSGIHQKDITYGAEKKIEKAIRETHKSFNSNLIGILNCSAPVLIGDDVEGVISSLNQ